MIEKDLREFLNYRNKTALRSECAFWIIAYSIVTILFVDLQFLLNINVLKNNKFCLVINLALTAFIILFVVFLVSIFSYFLFRPAVFV